MTTETSHRAVTPRLVPVGRRAGGLLVLAITLDGCSTAPSRNILGSYFPSWMICALGALALTLVVRALFVRIGVDNELPAPIVVYLAFAAAFSFALWLLWLR